MRIYLSWRTERLLKIIAVAVPIVLAFLLLTSAILLRVNHGYKAESFADLVYTTFSGYVDGEFIEQGISYEKLGDNLTLRTDMVRAQKNSGGLVTRQYQYIGVDSLFGTYYIDPFYCADNVDDDIIFFRYTPETGLREIGKDGVPSIYFLKVKGQNLVIIIGGLAEPPYDNLGTEPIVKESIGNPIYFLSYTEFPEDFLLVVEGTLKFDKERIESNMKKSILSNGRTADYPNSYLW